MFKHLVLISALVFALGCGSDDDDTGVNLESKKESFKYCYSTSTNGWGCTTGVQNFDSKDTYCQGLQDERKNSYCARDNRKGLFEQKCSSTFQPSDSAPEKSRTMTDDDACPK